ncbi:hypothetical protein MmarC5_1279 [Methanococcus maripaludis C5]|uniref:Uncharacterized protein n=1 Tax=Methanococcus maripaludis (strain C5 / ATCC BAA-1333) TaxID=402880 RepID=A4FZE3_METM5|nr:hypothetical protein [Methanococcus maripaludis]ABO35577.1 hypothetical protein MmarC5_1279 [Methanococcus maripaludis C5]
MAKNFRKRKIDRKKFPVTDRELQRIIYQLKNRKEINQNVMAVVNRDGKWLCIHANDEEKTVIYHNAMIMSDRFRIEV